ncbi:MAG: redoxin domain-containing protein [Saprospiraceae bacterium]|nr:redoxin domain-containing protein [Saprospiraceae bacterium]MCB9308998.1 redoxin domain-containing protein [Lewinellaceae bacterium]
MIFFRTLFLSLFLSFGHVLSLQAQEYQSFESFDALKAYAFKNNDTTYIVNFWATWCGPCVKELPYFESVYRSYASEKVKLILVSLDFLNKIESHFIPFLNEHHFSGEVWLLRDRRFNKWIDEVDPSWSGAIPVTLLIKGGLRKFQEGEFSSEEDLSIFVQDFISQSK